MKIKTIIKKNFQISLNSKLSSIILILGPLLLIVIMGLALQDTSIKNIKTSFYTQEDNQFSNDFINILQKRSFIVQNEKNLEDCKKRVLDSETNLCIEVKKENIDKSEVYDIKLHVDFSKQRIVWKIIGKIQGIIDYKSKEIRNSYIENLENRNEKILEEIDEKQKKINQIRGILSDIKIKIREINSNIREMGYSINTLKITSNSLENELIRLQQDPIIEQNYKEEILSIVNRLNLINKEISKIESKRNINDINNLRNYVNLLDDELQNIENSLNKIEKELKETQNTNLKRIADPIHLKYSSVSNNKEESVQNDFKFLDYLFPSFIIFYILFISMILTSTLRIRERKSNAYIRNIASKINGINFILSDFISFLILISLQLIIIILIASIFLNINFLNNIGYIILLLFIVSFIFGLIGIAIGSIFNSQETSIIASISASLLFLMFSSIIIPSETLPSFISNIVKILPLTMLETKLRLTMIFGNSLTFNIHEIASLLITLTITTSIIIFFYKKNKRKEI